MNLFKKIRRFVYYQKILVFAWNTEKYNKSFLAKIPVWIGYASLEEVKDLHMNQEMDLKVYPWRLLEEKIDNGTWKCIVAKFRKEMVGYAFYSTDEMSFAGTKSIEFDLPPNSAYIFRDFVHPKFRNLSVGKQLASFRIKALNECGTVIAFGVVNSTNKIQIYNCKEMGGDFVGSVTFISTKFFNKVFVSKSIYKAGLKIRRIYS